jgi:hypothetical protein
VAFGAVVEAVLIPVVFYPFSKTLWTAVDMVMHRGEKWSSLPAAGAPVTESAPRGEPVRGQ